MTAPPIKDTIGRPAGELVGVTGSTTTPPAFVRITGDTMTGDLIVPNISGGGAGLTGLHWASLTGIPTTIGGFGIIDLNSLGDARWVHLANVGVANGVAALDAGGKVPSAQLPAFSFGHVFTVASQTAMLALSTAVAGDLAVRSDISETFILSATPASTLGNWTQLLSPGGAVASVYGRTGSVTAQPLDVSYGDLANIPTTIAGISSGVATDFVTQGDANWVRAAGDTMSGPLIINDAAAGTNAYVLDIKGPTQQHGGFDKVGNLNFWGGYSGGHLAPPRLAFWDNTTGTDLSSTDLFTLTPFFNSTDFATGAVGNNRVELKNASLVIRGDTGTAAGVTRTTFGPSLIVQRARGSYPVTADIQQWTTQGDSYATATVLAGITATGGAYFGGDVTIGGTLTFTSPNFFFNFYTGITAGQNALGLNSGSNSGGDIPSYSGFTEGGQLKFVGPYFSGYRADPARIEWRLQTGSLGELGVYLQAHINSISWSDAYLASYIAGGTPDVTRPGSYMELAGGLQVLGPQFQSGSPSDMPSLIVQKSSPSAQTDVIRIYTAGLVPSPITGAGTPATLLAGVSATGGYWSTERFEQRNGLPPASSSAAGKVGQMAWDASYEYRCIATNSWQRTARGTGSF